MADFVARWNVIASVWCERLWAALWQSTLLTVVVALLAALALRRSSPALRYWVWTILAVKLLVMPFWTYAAQFPNVPFALPMQIADLTHDLAPIETADLPKIPDVAPQPTGEKAAEAPAIAPQAGALTSLWNQVTWQSWILLCWAAIVLGQCTRIIWQHRCLNRLLLQTRPADDQLAGLVRETARQLGLRQPPRTVLTDQDCSPFVCGIRRPTLVLPGNLLTALSASELTQVLLHELAHIRRLDLVWGWIGEGLRVVYFFHPAAHWISYRLRLERELACDSIAMSLSDQGPAEYAATLVNVISHASAPSVFKTSAVSAGLRGESR